MRLNSLSRIFAAAVIASACMLATRAAVGATIVNGKVKAELYSDIGGTSVASLTGSPNYPGKPSAVYYVNDLEFPDKDNFGNGTVPNGDVMNNYGARVSGFIIPKETADYVFALSSDDNSEFWLSTDENPANAKLVAFEPQWNGVRDYLGTARRTCVTDPNTGFVKCENNTNPIHLEANKKYAFYGLLKEGGGGDNFSVTWAKATDGITAGAVPISSEFLATEVSSAPSITSQPVDAAVFVNTTANFSIGLDIPPNVTVNSIQWFKNGTAIAGATANKLSLTAASADDLAKIKAVVTTSAGTLTSSEATLRVASLTDTFVQGIVKFEAYTGINGTSVQNLLDAQKFQDGTPDDVRLLGAIDSPNGYGDNYGAKVSGFIIPQSDGDFRFFIRSDDASQLYLSSDTDPANAVLIAEETGCCDPFKEPPAAETSEPVTMVKGQKYAFFVYLKEGGGGDYVQVAVRKEGDTTSAASLQPISGPWIGANAKMSIGDVTITQQPVGATLDEGRALNLTVAATTTPTQFNLPLLVQWQKNGVDIPGATSTTFTIPSVKTTDAGTYRAVLSAAGVKATNTAAVTVTINTDVTGPVLAKAGAVQKGTGVEIGLGFDEAVDATIATTASNYTVSKGTIQSVHYVAQDGGVVLSVSGVAAGDTVTVTAKNMKDLKGNVTATGSKDVKIPAKLMKWVGVGGDELNVASSSTRFNDDVVALSDKDFDLLSGGSQYWDNYDEATYVYEQVTGDFDKVVRVEYEDPVSQWSRGGLDIREALDEGKTKDDVTAGYKFSQNFTIRVNPAPVVGWDGRIGNNQYEVIHRPVEGGKYDPATYKSMFNILGGGGGSPAYPNAWLRLKREGQKITSFMSSDGKNWTSIGYVTYADDPDSPEDESLANTVFVGMFWGPEFVNIGDTTVRLSHDASIAKFRDYGDFVANVPAPQIAVTRAGNQVTISWTNGGSLESATALDGTWTTVSSTTPYTTTATDPVRFFRVKR